jgi:hypothetical protein
LVTVSGLIGCAAARWSGEFLMKFDSDQLMNPTQQFSTGGTEIG